MNEIQQRFSNFFLLRSVLSFVILALLFYSPQQISPDVWALATAYLASNLAVRILPLRRVENPAFGYGLFFVDIAVLTIILYSVSGVSSASLLLFYVTIFMATLGENVSRSVGIGFAISAVYFWYHSQTEGHFFFLDHEALLRIPLFLVTAVLCAYLAREVRNFKRQVRGLRDVQKTLELRIGQSSEDLALSEDLRLAAQDLADRFRTLVQDLNAGIWEMEVPSLRITFVSDQMVAILGYPTRQWLEEGDFWQQCAHPEDRAHLEERRRKAIADGRDYNFQYRAMTASGKTLWLQDIVRVVRDKSKKIRQLRGVTVDVTAHEQLEEEFRQAQKMEAVGRLAGGVAHDFNNLLTIITGYTELSMELLESGCEQVRSYQGEVLKAAERAGGLVRRLLAFTRRQALDPQVVDLNTIVKSTESMVHRLIGEDIEVLTITPPGLGSVRADPAQIEQVILNLSVNARDAMPNGGKLIVETTNVDLDQAYADTHITVTPGPYVMLAVSDTGAGMDAETRAHIFEPFFTTKEKGKGTGLGLATVYGIIKQSGGNVWVYSEVGKGTTFKIYLPRVDSTATTGQTVAIPEVEAHGSETILLVEDEDGIRSLVQGVLQAHGYTILEASHPQAALDIGERFGGTIHLMLTDVVMPKMSGREVAEKITSARPDTKVLYMSGYTDNAIAHHGVLNPDVPFLQKPFTPRVLAQKVRDVLDAVPATAQETT